MKNKDVLLPLLIAVLLPGIGYADPSSTSLCDMPQYRGTAIYNRYCGGGGSVQRYSGPTPEQLQQQREEAARQQRLATAHSQNQQGLDAWKKGDWAAAAGFFEQALQNNPDDQNIKSNLAAAKQKMKEQQDNQTAANNMQKVVSNLSQTFTAAPTAGGLDFDGFGGNQHTGGSDKKAGLDFNSFNAANTANTQQNTRQKGVNGNYSDTMVVDARNVPSGLPKSVDDAIPHSPAGDRMRKGLQAIQDGDWKVALAWFQDARNKEPGNPGIERLVELAQFTLEYRSHPHMKAVEKSAAPAQSIHQANPGQATEAARGKAAAQGEEPASSIVYSAAIQKASRERAEKAFKRYVEKYGDGNVAARESAVAKAARGDGYSNEELKAQLQKALIECRESYLKNHPDGKSESVGGSATFDEVILGGKG